MERAISREERIRRAEEIYNRRKMQNGVRVPTSHVNTKGKLEYRLLKKMILQILICLVIYFIFYLIKNSNYLFSENVLNKTKEFLAYDINFEEVFKQAGDYYQQHIKGFIEETVPEEEIEKKEEETIEKEKEQPIEEERQEENTQGEGGIGGGEEGSNLLANEIAQKVEEEKEPLSQMEIDAKEIKENHSFILPLEGSVTSRFGPRQATEIVSANHAGIDLGANEGTVYVAAMEGIVTCVSSEGGYGNHVYIEAGEVITLYAHCKEIYVKEGDTILQGQQIGEVGQTGNATGPHLHFEIRRENRVVNPELILTF